MSLSYNPDTQQQLDALRARPAHAILLVGTKGIGLFATAKDLAGSALMEIVRPTNSKGEHDEVNGRIHADEIRLLYVHTKGKGKNRRCYIIDNADKMNETAQNAFLKLLEEPVSGVQFILTAHSTDTLLPTVLSRLQRVTLKPLAHSQSAALLDDVADPKIKSQIAFLAEGLPAEIVRLKTDTKYFEVHSQYMRDAQVLVAGKSYEKIIVAFNYAADRSAALELLSAAKIILKHLITRTPSPQAIARAAFLTATSDAIRANGNVRLQLLRFVVQ